MLDILLIIHVVVAILLIAVILLQRNSADALAGLGGGGGGNMGIVTARSATNFMTRMTVILAIAFMGNSLVLANLSNKSAKHHDEKGLTEKLEEKSGEKESAKKVPMAE